MPHALSKLERVNSVMYHNGQPENSRSRRNPMQSSTRKLSLALLFVAMLMPAFMSTLFSTSLWADDDPLMGTWKLNVEKSKFSPGKPPLSATNTYKPYGKDGFQYTSDQVSA